MTSSLTNYFESLTLHPEVMEHDAGLKVPKVSEGKNLAELMLETQAAERNHDVDLAAARAQAVGPKAAEQFQLVRRFYADAAQKITQQIIDRVPTDKIGVKLGTDGHIRHHFEAYEALKGAGGPIHITAPSGPYYPLWLEFSRWAASQGLASTWTREHDGGGGHEWLFLSVAPEKVKQYRNG